MNNPPKNAIVKMVAIWIALTLVGFRQLSLHDSTPTSKGAITDEWPAKSQLKRDPTKTTLILFLHPYCPCSKASVHNLIEITNQVGSGPNCLVVFVRPDGAPKDWVQSDLYRQCLDQPNFHVFVDDLGREASLFGAKSSGHAFIYRVNQKLAFSGGITSSRGQLESGPERQQILTALMEPEPLLQHSPVFGCALQ